MGPKKDKKLPQAQKDQKMKALQTNPTENSDSFILSTASFVEGLQKNNGTPLHSTALEEGLASPVGEKVQRKLKKQTTKQKKEKEKGPKSSTEKSTKTGLVTNQPKGKKAIKRKSSGDADAARPVKKQKVKDTKKTLGSEKEKNPRPQKTLGSEKEKNPRPQKPDGSQMKHKDTFTSDEELEESWKPSPKKLNSLTSKKSRTLSLDKAKKSPLEIRNEPEKPVEKKNLKRSGITEAEVLLEEFLDFYQKYKETVESNTVKQALDFFASNLKQQLTEKICSSKRLKTVMRENSKLASAIRTKRQRLLDAKNELNKSERQVRLLQKDKSELEQNLKDLNRGKSFLQNLGMLNKRYLQHRTKNPHERETYGTFSLPALLMEAKHIQTTEHQLEQINDELQKELTK